MSSTTPTPPPEAIFDYDFTNQPYVRRMHCYIVGPYAGGVQFHSWVDYILFDVLSAQMQKDAIKHYTEQDVGPEIAMTVSDGSLARFDRISQLNDLGAIGGADYLLYPLQLRVRRFYNVGLKDLEQWSREFTQEQEERNKPDKALPTYKREATKTLPKFELPLMEEWIGMVNHDHRSMIKSIMERTNELQNLHQYVSTNKQLYSEPDGRNSGKESNDIFEVAPCTKFYCSICHEFTTLEDMPGIFTFGEKLDPGDRTFRKAKTRYIISEAKKDLETLEELFKLADIASEMSDLSDQQERDSENSEERIRAQAIKEMMEEEEREKEKERK